VAAGAGASTPRGLHRAVGRRPKQNEGALLVQGAPLLLRPLETLAAANIGGVIMDRTAHKRLSPSDRLRVR